MYESRPDCQLFCVPISEHNSLVRPAIPSSRNLPASRRTSPGRAQRAGQGSLDGWLRCPRLSLEGMAGTTSSVPYSLALLKVDLINTEQSCSGFPSPMSSVRHPKFRSGFPPRRKHVIHRHAGMSQSRCPGVAVTLQPQRATDGIAPYPCVDATAGFRANGFPVSSFLRRNPIGSLGQVSGQLRPPPSCDSCEPECAGTHRSTWVPASRTLLHDDEISLGVGANPANEGQVKTGQRRMHSGH